MTKVLQNSEPIVIAARLSMGRTAWAINIAQNNGGKDGQDVAVFLVEMSNESSRLASSDNDVDQMHLFFTPHSDRNSIPGKTVRSSSPKGCRFLSGSHPWVIVRDGYSRHSGFAQSFHNVCIGR
jgi:hypothetical protein